MGSWAGAWGDYDNDGDLDLLTIGHVQAKTNSISQLWNNDLAQGSFTDVTEAAGLDPTNGDCHGVVWADFDNDGDLDLYITKGSAKRTPKSEKNFHELWINDGNRHFVNTAESSGVRAVGHRGRGVYSFDFNLDGRLDLFSLSWRRTIPDQGNVLFQQEDNSTFVDVAPRTGVSRPGKPTYQDRYRAPGNRVGAWADYNNDGWPDVLIMQPLALFANSAAGHFSNVTKATGLKRFSFPASAAWGDYDNDGDLDLYITMNNGGRGVLYANQGNGTFEDVTEGSGIDNAEEARAAVWGDYDNDGDLDLYVVNARNEAKANRLYRNDGGRFEDVAREAGVEAQTAGSGIDATFVDYNNDGLLDLFLTNGNGTRVGPYVLLKNNGNGNHWLNIRLLGHQSNRDGLGAKVTVSGCPCGVQYQEHDGPEHHLAQNSAPLHFGVGSSDHVSSIIVVWPSGVHQLVENIAVDQTILVEEPVTASKRLAGVVPAKFRQGQRKPSAR